MVWHKSPLANAGISAEVLARVELKTAQELRAGVGGLLPVPEGMSDDTNKGALQTDLGDAQGKYPAGRDASQRRAVWGRGGNPRRMAGLGS